MMNAAPIAPDNRFCRRFETALLFILNTWQPPAYLRRSDPLQKAAASRYAFY
jgi:hypothetical protein